MSYPSGASKPLRVRLHLLTSDTPLREWIRGNGFQYDCERQIICDNARYADLLATGWMNHSHGRGCWHERYEAQ